MSTALPGAPVPVLADLVPARLFRGAVACDAALVVGAAGFVGLAAQLSVAIPGSPVPATGQTLAVLLAATPLSTRRA